MIKNFTGIIYKHHISEHFESGECPLFPNGVGKGGTVFLDYNFMIDYLKKTNKKWHIAKIELNNEPLLFEFDSELMATTLRSHSSFTGFYPL